jgi:hypothetical protein
MRDQQITFYTACPIWYWPWLWLQFRRLDRWLARYPEQETNLLLHMNTRGTLTITFMSDNLRDDLPTTYTTLTFESLTWAYWPEWMYSVTCALTCRRSEGDASFVFTSDTEIADALIPIP